MNRAALCKFTREWWPEIVWVSFATPLTLVTPGPKLPNLAIVMVFSVIFWLMGHRHRRLPMQATLDGVKQDVRQVRDILLAEADAAEADDEPPGRPDLKLVR